MTYREALAYIQELMGNNNTGELLVGLEREKYPESFIFIPTIKKEVTFTTTGTLFSDKTLEALDAWVVTVLDVTTFGQQKEDLELVETKNGGYRGKQWRIAIQQQRFTSGKIYWVAE